MAKRPLPSAEQLRKFVDYNPENGSLTWRSRSHEDFTSAGKISAETRAKQWNNRCAGKPAFSSVAPNGYAVGPFGIGTTFYAHRIAFAIVEGRWPHKVDHINGDRTDNRWCNLREVSDRQNAMNCATRSDSATGRTGVRLDRRKGAGFRAYIKAEGRHIHLGRFDTFDEAVAARETAEKHYGFSERHGTH